MLALARLNDHPSRLAALAPQDDGVWEGRRLRMTVHSTAHVSRLTLEHGNTGRARPLIR